jgi:hypothetical protein
MSDTITNLENTTLINCKLFEFFAQHFMLECRGCNETIKCREKIIDFMNCLISTIQTSAENSCTVQRVKEDHIVVTQITDDGHITLHLSAGKLFLDVFNRKRFDIPSVKSLVIQHFGVKTMKETCLDRGI